MYSNPRPPLQPDFKDVAVYFHEDNDTSGKSFEAEPGRKQSKDWASYCVQQQLI